MALSYVQVRKQWLHQDDPIFSLLLPYHVFISLISFTVGKLVSKVMPSLFMISSSNDAAVIYFFLPFSQWAIFTGHLPIFQNDPSRKNYIAFVSKLD
jgi:hypothetical protein